ncbi:MAG: flagellar biosynthetic protein FliO [Halioglobus sp.]
MTTAVLAIARHCLFLASLLVAGGVHAAAAEPPRAEIFDSAYLMQVIGALLLVFGCLFGFAYVMKRFNGVPAGDRKSLRVVGSVKVGNREKIVLLDTGENQLLVGVAAGNVRTLYVYEEKQSAPERTLVQNEAKNSTAQESARDFASLMPSPGIPGARA